MSLSDPPDGQDQQQEKTKKRKADECLPGNASKTRREKDVQEDIKQELDAEDTPPDDLENRLARKHQKYLEASRSEKKRHSLQPDSAIQDEQQETPKGLPAPGARFDDHSLSNYSTPPCNPEYNPTPTQPAYQPPIAPAAQLSNQSPSLQQGYIACETQLCQNANFCQYAHSFDRQYTTHCSGKLRW
jgi:hypothetical protein